MSSCALQLVTWNGERYIPWLFASLRAQSRYPDIVRIVDNGSTDGTVMALERELASVPFRYEFIRNTKNSGFAGGHNQLARYATEDYVGLINQDLYLQPDCLARLVAVLETEPQVAAVTPRLMVWDFKKIALQGLLNSFTDRIDSLGLCVQKNRRVIEWYGGEEWSKISARFEPGDGSFSVRGVSGALPLYRRYALNSCATSLETWFDPFFESYKEDIDLAFRLERGNWQARVVPGAVAYHDRTAAMPLGGLGDLAAARSKKMQSERVQFLSYRNHLLLLYKQGLGADFWRNAIWIAWYEAKKLFFLLVHNPRLVIRAWRDIIRYIFKKPPVS